MIQEIDNIKYITPGELPYGMTMDDAAMFYWRGREQVFYYDEALKLLSKEQKEGLKKKTIEWVQSEKKRHIEDNKEVMLFWRMNP